MKYQDCHALDPHDAHVYEAGPIHLPGVWQHCMGWGAGPRTPCPLCGWIASKHDANNPRDDNPCLNYEPVLRDWVTKERLQMATPNPYLFPSTHNRAGLQVHLSTPAALDSALPGVSRGIGQILNLAGFSISTPEVIRDHAELTTGDNTLRVLFPPATPTVGATIYVVDPGWQFVAVDYTSTTAETFGHPTNRFYFDLYTGNWLTFTTQMLPMSISSPYVSYATYFEVPREDTV